MQKLLKVLFVLCVFFSVFTLASCGGGGGGGGGSVNSVGVGTASNTNPKVNTNSVTSTLQITGKQITGETITGRPDWQKILKYL